MHLTMNQSKRNNGSMKHWKKYSRKANAKSNNRTIVAKSTTIGNQIEKMNTELLLTVY